MGSCIPFIDEQPFAERVKTMADDELLENWDRSLPSFVKVMPKDYKRALQQARDRAASKAVAAE